MLTITIQGLVELRSAAAWANPHPEREMGTNHGLTGHQLGTYPAPTGHLQNPIHPIRKTRSQAVSRCQKSGSAKTRPGGYPGDSPPKAVKTGVRTRFFGAIIGRLEYQLPYPPELKTGVPGQTANPFLQSA